MVAIVLQSGWITGWAGIYSRSQLLKLRMWSFFFWWNSVYGREMVLVPFRWCRWYRWWPFIYYFFFPEILSLSLSFFSTWSLVFPFNKNVCLWFLQCVWVYIRKCYPWLGCLTHPTTNAVRLNATWCISHSTMRSQELETMSGKLAF